MKKKSHNAEKTERGHFGIFQHPFYRKTAKKLKGEPLGKKFPEKSLTVPKIEKGDPLVSFGLVCYAGNLFTFLVQFLGPTGTIWCLLKIL